jgi:hypothetical protein
VANWNLVEKEVLLDVGTAKCILLLCQVKCLAIYMAVLHIHLTVVQVRYCIYPIIK